MVFAALSVSIYALFPALESSLFLWRRLHSHSDLRKRCWWLVIWRAALLSGSLESSQWYAFSSLMFGRLNSTLPWRLELKSYLNYLTYPLSINFSISSANLMQSSAPWYTSLCKRQKSLLSLLLLGPRICRWCLAKQISSMTTKISARGVLRRI